MKDKILYIIIGVLFVIVIVVVVWAKKSDNVIDYGILKSEHTRIRKEMRELQTKIIKYDDDIFRIKREMVKNDSSILNADSKQLDSLFADFFDRFN